MVQLGKVLIDNPVDGTNKKIKSESSPLLVIFVKHSWYNHILYVYTVSVDFMSDF